MFKLSRISTAALCMAVISLSSCVDNDYDLTEDIDLNMTLGGNMITLPSSSTDKITLDQIFDIDYGSSIKAAESVGQYGLKNIGDYALVQSGHAESSEYHIDEVVIDNMAPNVMRSGNLNYVNVGLPKITARATTTNKISLHSSNVTDQLVALYSAEVAVDINFTVGFESNDYSGTAYIDTDFRAVFPDSWTVEITDPSTRQFLKVLDDGHTVSFINDTPIRANNPLKASIHLSKVNLENLPDGQGLHDGEFNLDCELKAEGDVSLTNGDLPVGGTANLVLVTSTSVVNTGDPGKAPRILSVTGEVNPDIPDVETSFDITDIPDFLSEGNNTLDMDNPQITFVVDNSSPLSVEVSGVLEAFLKNAPIANVKIGSKYGFTPITVTPGHNTIVLSRRPVAGSGVTNVVVDNLSDIIETIPDRISFVAECQPVKERVTFELGSTYVFDVPSYEAVVRLAFGDKMHLNYTHNDQGWDSDLDDYNFDTVEVSLTAINTVPLSMTPEVKALGVGEDNVLTEPEAKVEGLVAAGTLDSPSRSTLKITISSKGASLSDLDGIRLIFDAVTTEASKGVNLNKEQSLKFEDIRIKILGGISVDLNDRDDE